MHFAPAFCATLWKRRTRSAVTNSTQPSRPLVSLVAPTAVVRRDRAPARFVGTVLLAMLGAGGCASKGAPSADGTSDASVSPANDADSGAGNPPPNPSPNPADTDDDSDAVTPNNPPSPNPEATSDDAHSNPGATSSQPSATDPDPSDPAVEPPPDVIVIPSRIEAEQFVRFNETDAPMDANECGDGRVDMGLTDDNDGECYVGWTQGGEWLEYDVWSAADTAYTVTLRLASDDARELSVFVDGKEFAKLDAPAAGWTEWRDVAFDFLMLSAGTHVIRVVFTSGQTNFNYMTFEAEGAPPAPTDPAVSSTPPDATQTDDPGPDTGDATGGVVVGAGCADVPNGYQLVWSDEFDVDGLPDATHWGYETGGDGWGNNELQYYTADRPENAEVKDGVLTITAIDEQYQNNTYTSAKLNSSLGEGNPGAWNEGILRIRARLPAGLGTWPAIWMMPNTCPEGWPNCGEIDIMEHVGYDEGTVHGTIHTDAFNHVEGTQNGNQVLIDDATSAFHDYTLIWTTDRLQWLVDDEIYHTIDKEAGWGFAEWPFNEKDWHLKLNLAVGGSWGGAEGVDADDFPARFDIDHVCVYQTAP